MIEASKFDKDYFHGENYDYGENSSFYEKVNWYEVATTMLNKYRSITGEKCTNFFDVGCAKGYLLKAMCELGVEKCVGIDISEFAINEAIHIVPAEVRVKAATVNDIVFRHGAVVDFISAFGVLHYLNEEEVSDFIRKCSHNVKVLNFGQFPLGDDKKTVASWKKNDEYTQLFKPFVWWMELLTKNNFNLCDVEWFRKDEEINLYFVNRYL